MGGCDGTLGNSGGGIRIPERREGADGVLYGANINPDDYEKRKRISLFNGNAAVTMESKKWPITPDVFYSLWDDNIGFRGEFDKMNKGDANQQLVAKKRKDGNWDIFRKVKIRQQFSPNLPLPIFGKTYFDLQDTNLTREDAAEVIKSFDEEKKNQLRKLSGKDISGLAL